MAGQRKIGSHWWKWMLPRVYKTSRYHQEPNELEKNALLPTPLGDDPRNNRKIGFTPSNSDNEKGNRHCTLSDAKSNPQMNLAEQIASNKTHCLQSVSENYHKPMISTNWKVQHSNQYWINHRKQMIIVNWKG